MPRDSTYGIVCGGHVLEKDALARRLRRNQTPAELVLWSHLRRNGLNGLHYRRQQVIDGLIADFYCHTAALVVEVDGPIHESARDHDTDRDAVLLKRGLVVLRFTNDQVMKDVAGVLSNINDVAAERIAART